MTNRVTTSVKPRALKSKDKVALVAPSARPYKPSDLNHCIRVVEAMGFVPFVGKHVMSCRGHSAGSDGQRLEDINSFIADDSIAAIFCLTGGVGALAIVDRIDYKRMASGQICFVGADDNNVIGMAAGVKAGLVTFYGPNLDDIKNRAQMEAVRDYLCGKSQQCHEVNASINSGDFEFSRDYIPVAGVAEGNLVGGNLTALTSLFGTPFQPSMQDGILCIDDRDERNDILDRWFTMIWNAGELEKINGIILGPFENCDSRGSFNLLSLEDDLGERLKVLNKPCRFDFPMGNCHLIPLGVSARFDATNGKLTFLESIFH